MLSSDLQLFRRHVDADNSPVFSSTCVTIATRSAAKIQDTKTLNSKREWCSTSIEFGVDFRRNALDNCLHDRMGSSRSRASAGLKVLAGGQNFAIVLLQIKFTLRKILTIQRDESAHT